MPANKKRPRKALGEKTGMMEILLRLSSCEDPATVFADACREEEASSWPLPPKTKRSPSGGLRKESDHALGEEHEHRERQESHNYRQGDDQDFVSVPAVLSGRFHLLGQWHDLTL